MVTGGIDDLHSIVVIMVGRGYGCIGVFNSQILNAQTIIQTQMVVVDIH